MPDDDGIFRHVRGDPLVIRPLGGRFVGGHADAVGKHFGEDFPVGDFGEVEFLHPEIHNAVQADCLGLHDL